MVRKIRMYVDYPWPIVEFPEGYVLRVVDAACHSREHHGHRLCTPGWRENLPDGTIVVAGPILEDYSGWIALVAIPPGARLVGRSLEEF
jgi:hypothetical protein